MADAWRVTRGFLCLAVGGFTGDHLWWLCAALFGTAGCFDAMRLTRAALES
jgi:hypothetical protein